MQYGHGPAYAAYIRSAGGNANLPASIVASSRKPSFWRPLAVEVPLHKPLHIYIVLHFRN